MAALLAFTCFLFAALPRLFNELADDGLRYMVEGGAVDARNVRMLQTGHFAAGPASEPLRPLVERGNRSRKDLPPALRTAVGDSTSVVRTPRYIFQPDSTVTVLRGPSTPGAVGGLIRFLTLRVQPEVGGHLRVVSGRFPQLSREVVTPEVRQPIFGVPSPFRPRGAAFVAWKTRVPVLEIALSAPTARELRLRIGDYAVYLPDRAEYAFRSVPIRDAKPLVVKLVGLIEVRNLRDPYWFGEEGVQTPSVQSAQDVGTTRVYAHAVVSSEAYPTFLAATRPVPLTYEFRHYVDPERIAADELGALNGAVAELETRYAAAGPLDPKAETGLGEIFQRYSAARSLAETLLAVAAIGLFACALANVGLLGALWYSRRRIETGVSRARGAAPLQVLAAQTLEGLLIAAPAGLLGWAAAVLLVEARPSNLSAWLVAGLVASTVVLLVVTIAGVARRPLRAPSRDDVVILRPSSRRLVLEATIAVAAAAGVYLLRRRGLESGGANAAFDPYLAAVPVLLGVACGIVALRLYPLPIMALARLVRHSRGLAVHLGLNRAARQSDIGSVPLIVLVLALAIACFSASMLATIEAGQNESAWRVVGADARIDGQLTELGVPLPARLVDHLDDEGQVARAYVQDVEAGQPGEETPLIAVELEAFERIVRGTPAEMRFPTELRNPPIPGVIPAVVSTNWPVADTFQITLPRVTVNTFVVGNLDSFPGIPPETPFAIVPWTALKTTEAEGEIVRPNRLYVGGVSAAVVRAAVEDIAPASDLETPAAVVDGLRERPLIRGVLRGFRAAIVLAAMYAAIAVGLMALIAARSRGRDLALVRTMGAAPRDVLLLAAVEIAPLVITALALGIALGVAIPHLIEPGLDLAFFTGSGSTPIVIPWRTPVVAATGLLTLVAATVAVVGFRARRAGLDSVLRVGDQ
jgi:putative ABC transport system permease protein